MAKQLITFSAEFVKANAVLDPEDIDDLVQSISEASAVGCEAIIYTNLIDPPYPAYLEYGTSKMPAYPSARPAFDENVDAARVLIVQQLKAVYTNALAKMAKGDSSDVSQAMVNAAYIAGGNVISRAWSAKLYDGQKADSKTGTYARSIAVRVAKK